ncbi:MAG: STAS domain-containing protein [Streptosporangiaceae bacterium]|nr:STAS domain-containing protein [Streptosporangiaceae bacterium]
MAFNATLRVSEETATVRLVGELDVSSAPRFNDLIAEAAGYKLSRLVMLADELTYMSSAGLRCLVFAHQKMPPGVEIMFLGAQPDVAETIKLTGFDRSIVLQEASER